MKRDDDRHDEARARNAKVGWTSFGANLFLRVDQGADGVTRRRWICRVTRDRRKRDFGCGALADTSVKLARRRRDEILETLRRGEDPVAEKRARREARVAARKATHTFRDACDEVMANREGAWKAGSSSFAAWRKSLYIDCRTLLRLPVGEVTVAQVKAVVEPFWRDGHHVASRGLLSRIETVLGYAIAHEWRLTANVAAWSTFEHIAPVNPNGKRHHAMIDWREMPSFVAKLRESKNSLSAVALELIALTACRSNEVRGMRFDEIDWTGKVWTIPPERMKRKIEFKVPLSRQTLALLKTLDATKAPRAQLAFPGPQPGKSIANQGLWTQMGRTTGKTATTHGLRASFKSWCEDVGVDHKVAEFCLAHAKGDSTESAYSRGQMIERRRAVMQKWADLLDGKASAKVVQLKRGKR
jgi:integrase